MTSLPGSAPGRERYGILDIHMGGYCTLPDDNDATSLLPLEWRTRAGAQAWLWKCYQAWERNPWHAPKEWRPMPYEPSPWSVTGPSWPPYGASTR